MDLIPDIDGLLYRLAAPLPPDRQSEFLQAAQDALRSVNCVGPGNAYRTVAKLLPAYFIPIIDYSNRNHRHNGTQRRKHAAAPVA
jgi:hypothetical protein